MDERIKPRKKLVHLILDEELFKELEDVRRHGELSYLVRRLLRKYLKNPKIIK